MPVFDSATQQVIAICRTLLEQGYFQAAEGNVSVRVAGQQAFAITPSSYDYAKMQAADICVLDFARRVLAGARKPSSESGMHAAVYQHRPDVQAVIHAHPPYVSALALIRAPIPALFDEQVRFLGRSVELIAYAPSGTTWLKNRVKSQIKSGNNAYILQNHGALVFGGDPERAVHNLALLEKCALTYLLALCTARPVSQIPLAAREIVFAKLKADEKKLAGRA